MDHYKRQIIKNQVIAMNAKVGWVLQEMAFPPIVRDLLQVRIVSKLYFFETQRHREH